MNRLRAEVLKPFFGSGEGYIAGKRDLRLDYLRGYCIFVMTLTHLGLASPLIFVTGGSRFLINAAEVFFFISGFTIGLIAVGRPLGQQVTSRLTRAWLIYRYVVLFSFLLTALLSLEMFREYSRGELTGWMIRIITLKEGAFDMDILIAYVIYVALAPLALWGLDRNRTPLVLGAFLCVYALTQLDPDAMSLDVSAFRHPAANSPLFFGALVLGYHREAVGAWWQSHRAGRVVDAVVVVVGAVLFVGFVLDYGGNEAVQEFLGSFVVREFLMPPHSLLIVLVYLRILWLLTTRLWSILHRLGGWLFMPFGQDSMFAYCMQAGLIVWFHQLDTPINEDSHAVLRLAGEAAVVGLMLGAVLLRQRLGRSFGTEHQRAWIRRHLLNILIWASLVMMAVLAIHLSEPGGWWWQEGYPFDDW
ncbi:MAG: hypothetical protein F4Y80_01965 [Caldilineaceae bacterium SB0665_bin_21]|nr:hypothetical protein [Caldilineaceae bacterium SB0665_bin_21]MYA04650.1 hypothetical protein [Caldilineaceae bacterium SB0664_bin_22]MYC63680.1 hypothetical protein [Caldilineaceae bacterium SB0661_bin_34]